MEISRGMLVLREDWGQAPRMSYQVAVSALSEGSQTRSKNSFNFYYKWLHLNKQEMFYSSATIVGI